MDPATLIGILIVLIALALGVTLEGGHLIAYLNLPAFMIVMVGTAGVTLAGVRMRGFMKIPVLILKALKSRKAADGAETADTIVRLADRARRDGLLAIEDDVAELPDPFLRKGFQLVVDGSDPEVVRDVLQADIDGMASRHRQGAALFSNAAGYSPTLGILGTVLGLVHVLEQLEDPGKLGPAIATAFIATLYGVGAANVFYLPIANKLKALSTEEIEQRELVLEGILAVQAGENPRIIGEKLRSYLPPVKAKQERQRDADRPAPEPRAVPSEEPA